MTSNERVKNETQTGDKKMTNQTVAAAKIVNRIVADLKFHFVSCPEQMMENIFGEAQKLANEGYCWDVALAKACKMYPSTRDAGNAAY